MTSTPITQRSASYGNMDLPIQFGTAPLCNVCLRPVRGKGTFSPAQLLAATQEHLDRSCAGSRSATVTAIRGRACATGGLNELRLHYQQRRSH